MAPTVRRASRQVIRLVARLRRGRAGARIDASSGHGLSRCRGGDVHDTAADRQGERRTAGKGLEVGRRTRHQVTQGRHRATVLGLVDLHDRFEIGHTLLAGQDRRRARGRAPAVDHHAGHDGEHREDRDQFGQAHGHATSSGPATVSRRDTPTADQLEGVKWTPEARKTISPSSQREHKEPSMRKTPTVRWGSFKKSRRRPTLPGGDPQVPSALVGLTAVFGMETGISPPP